MEAAEGAETVTVLRRLVAWSEKIFDLSAAVIAPVSDRRLQPRIPTAVVVKSAFVMFWARMGSLNALELSARAGFWKKWLPAPSCSADTMGRVHALMDASELRQGIHHIYERLKRNKALPDTQGMGIAVVDGHESHTSYLQHCSGCLKRTLHLEAGDRIQFYHRQVTLMLLPGAPGNREPIRLLLDHEPQQPGEDEVAAAMRLLERVILAYPRAFDLVLADALYGTAPFFNFLLARHKHALVVLKDERRNLYQDVAGLFDHTAPQKGTRGSRECLWWDFPDLLSWPQVNGAVRVLRSLETWSVRRQLDHRKSTQTSDWTWVTTLPTARASTARAIGFGHQRWDIENHGFNELVNEWRADHVFRHEPNAMECFLLIAFLAYNIFHAFWALSLKPQIKQGTSRSFWATLISAELHGQAIPGFLSP
ncbi:MAG: transposase [Chloroflexota bacterium]